VTDGRVDGVLDQVAAELAPDLDVDELVLEVLRRLLVRRVRELFGAGDPAAAGSVSSTSLALIEAPVERLCTRCRHRPADPGYQTCGPCRQRAMEARRRIRARSRRSSASGGESADGDDGEPVDPRSIRANGYVLVAQTSAPPTEALERAHMGAETQAATEAIVGPAVTGDVHLEPSSRYHSSRIEECSRRRLEPPGTQAPAPTMPAGGLTLDELLARTGCAARALRMALQDEVSAGRVLVQDGRYRLRPGSLPPDLGRALVGLAAPDTAVLRNGRNGGPSGGRLTAHERRNVGGFYNPY
jgi:hypothetical protein